MGSLNVLQIVKLAVNNTPLGVLTQFEGDKFIEMLIKRRIVHLKQI